MNKNMSEDALSVLVGARRLLGTPDRWVQGEAAVDKNGNWTPTNSKSACRWCALGALWTVETIEQKSGCARVVRHILETYFTNGRSIMEFNDSHPYEEVIKIFDDAIEFLKQKIN